MNKIPGREIQDISTSISIESKVEWLSLEIRMMMKVTNINKPEIVDTRA